MWDLFGLMVMDPVGSFDIGDAENPFAIFFGI
jgi:hypothetical protein